MEQSLSPAGFGRNTCAVCSCAEPCRWTHPSHWDFCPHSDPLPGRIKVDFVIPKELPFGDKDTKSKVTLLESDHVRFNISTDRRDKLERATNIEVLPNTFQFTNETREMASIHLQKFLILEGEMEVKHEEGGVFYNKCKNHSCLPLPTLKSSSQICSANKVEISEWMLCIFALEE